MPQAITNERTANSATAERQVISHAVAKQSVPKNEGSASCCSHEGK